jgi:hypothetical protein
MSIFSHFPHITLSKDQESALQKIDNFLSSETDVFILKGYAGSGKTTILKGLVEYLHQSNRNFSLMAPTGRAAKVIREKTGQEAYTIHKSIYSYEDLVENEENESFFYEYKIRNNLEAHNRVYIVDEASMVSNGFSQGEYFRFGTGCLLDDLISFSRIGEPLVNAKIIFVGDPCQLPPVSDNSSNALDADYLATQFKLSVEEAEMKEVKRQSGKSGILEKAGKIRKSISSGYFNDFDLRSNNKDIVELDYNNFLNIWDRAEGTKIIIGYKNETCLEINNEIRKRLWGSAELPVQIGEIIILGGNNYRKNVFNGEFGVVSNISQIPIVRDVLIKNKPSVTLSWREIELVFPDIETENKTVKGLILENFISGENYLKPEETQALYVDFVKRHPTLKPKSEEFKQAIMNDEYFNCLLLKFGYAVTCHKAQGGEWENVFTIWDHENRPGFNCYKDKQLRSGKTNVNFYRWAYTAVTRASKKLFALNPPFFNSYSSVTFIEQAVTNALETLTGKKITTEELIIEEDALKEMEKFGLLNEAVQLQDHFIALRHSLRKHYIDISDWEKKGSEISYKFSRVGDKAALKTWINKDHIFNGKYMKLPSLTNNDEFYKETEFIIVNMPPYTVLRNTAETVLSGIEFEIEQEEKFPFTKNLYDDLQKSLTGSNIVIDEIKHQSYRERYTFVRGSEKAVLDFEYNGDGFFGRVVVLNNHCNSNILIYEIKNIVIELSSKSI